MSGKRDWTTWMRKRSTPVLCALGAVLLCCLQSSASVSDEVPEFTEEPSSVVQKLGGSVSLRCAARPASASISWRLNGRQLTDGDLGVALGPAGLFIATLSNVTLGRYRCVATTGVGALASVPADVTAAKLRDFEPDDQQEIEVDEGNTAVIECHLPESQPKAQVRYSVKQEWLETSKGNYLIMPSGNLQIANATREDEGPYKCAAYNPVTQEVKTSSSADRLRIRRSTSEAARIIYPPASRSIMVTRGQRLVLECVASGIPTPHVTWAKDGQDLRVHNNTRFLLSNLLIDAAAEGDSGTYACRADNGAAAVAATVLYEVQVFEPPQVAVELQQQEVLLGETVRFTCQARGKPAPAVTWLHNAIPLSPSPRHRLTPRMLRVSNVGPQDEGLYQCVAENGVGSSQASARLIAVSTGITSRGKLPAIFRPLSPDKVLREQPPVRPGAAGATLPLDCAALPGQILPAEAPVILSQPRTGRADYYELTWRPRHERGAPVLEYMIKYRKVGDPSAEWTSSSISGSLHKLTLAKLQPDSLYEVEMAAKNCAGLGQPAMMTFRTGKGRKGLGGHNDLPKTPAVPSPSLLPPEAPDKPTVSTATETSAYVAWIPRGNRGFPIQSFRVEYKKVKKAGEDWVTAVENIPPSRLSVEITGLEKGTSYKFRVVAVNVIGSSPPSAPSKAYTVVGGRTHERPVDGPYITYNEAINETTVILKWTYTPVNNTPIYGFYIYYRPTDSDNDSDYKKDVVEGDRYWHSIGDLQPETAYDIKMQSFNEKGESDFGNVVILETKARPHHHRPVPSEGPERETGRSGGLVPRPGDLPYLIVVVLGAFVFIIVVFIPFCLWRAWAKQKQTSDLCFVAAAAPVSSPCQYTMVPLQGLALVGRCPADGHLAVPHALYPPSEHNGKAHHEHLAHGLPGLHQEEVDMGMECNRLLPQQGLANGYHFCPSDSEHHEQMFESVDDSSLQLLGSSRHLDGQQESTPDEDGAGEELSQKLASFPAVVSLEDEGIFTTSSSTAATPQSQDAVQEASVPPSEVTG
ncbi:brother of CDO [Syngnathus acus]|uniref:brother of CDO n=1 Tax=Syngnathus acus TaxID=161584 RepID=UPI001885D688|nr:brother of CDO [Syngnathus acus]XP_037135996.1 brother of CDO [Syngnathus acus]